MKTALTISFALLLTACPSKTQKIDQIPVKHRDAGPSDAHKAVPADAKPGHPIVRDERLQMIKDAKETAYSSVPVKLDAKIGFGVIAVTMRDGVAIDPAEVTVKFLGKHQEGRWRECLSAVPHMNGAASPLSSKPTYESKEQGALVVETMSVRLTSAELDNIAFAAELKVWLCEDIVTFSAEDQKLLQAVSSELRSPRSE
jgi:hypothetical protein